jgi:hypothetical protein
MNEAVEYINQEFNEKRYNRKFIDCMIRQEIDESKEIQQAIDKGVELLQKWLSKTYYESKNLRLEAVKHMDLRTLVNDIFVFIAYFQYEELFTSVTAQLAGRLGFDDKQSAITTMAEIVAVLADTDVYDLFKEGTYASVMVRSNMYFSDQLNDFIENSQYLPPMVCEPNELKHNRSSGYLTVQNDSLILGSGNHHEDDICLDVLNTLNKTELQLDTEFLSQFEEEPTYDLITLQQKDLWKRYKIQCYRFYELMVSQGNRFHLTHKVDKRGRIYAQGYHITTQGTSFKKASIDLYKEEVVTGV